MLPTLTPNRSLADALSRIGCDALASEVRWAANHYAVDGHRFPEQAAYDAACAVAACIADWSPQVAEWLLVMATRRPWSKPIRVVCQNTLSWDKR